MLYIFKRKWIYPAALLVMAIFFLHSPDAKAATYDDTVIIEATCDYDKASEELDLLNDEREDEGLSELTMDADLQEAAMERAVELSLNFSHTRPNGTSCFTINSGIYAENVAAGYSTASAVTNGWMNSSGHKANMLGSSYTRVGIGCVKVGSITFWVQDFGKGTASAATTTGSFSQMYTIDIDYDTVTFEGSGFNLNLSQEDPEPLTTGETYDLHVGILNAGWSGTYAHTSGTGYTWESSDTSVITVDSEGNVTAVGTGEATITAVSVGGWSWTKTFSVTETEDAQEEDSSGSTGTVSQTKPGRVAIASLKSTAKKKATVRIVWKSSRTKSAKYQVAYRVKGTKKWTKVTSANKKVILKKLKSGKKYQVKVRAFTKSNGTRTYGKWSAIKTVKIK